MKHLWRFGWSAPGTALLGTLFLQMSINEAVAAYIVSARVIFLVDITGSLIISYNGGQLVWPLAGLALIGMIAHYILTHKIY